MQEIVIAAKQFKGRNTGPHMPKNRLLRSQTSLKEV